MAALSLVLWAGVLDADLPPAGFLALHTTLEMASVIVGMLAFGIAWHAYSQERPGNIVILGLALFGAGLLDFAHTLSYPGMPIFVTPAATQKAISFWLAARVVMAAALLVIATRGWQPLKNRWTRHSLMLSVLIYVASAYGLILYTPDLLPDWFVTGRGLTDTKIGVEYVLVLVYGMAALLLLGQAEHGNDARAYNLYAAAGIAALSELYFTQYGRVTDMVNGMGHVYKVASYCFIYQAVFVDSVRQPFMALSDQLQNERTQSLAFQAVVKTMDMLEEAVIETDTQGRVVQANQGWCKLVGAASGTGMRLIDQVREEDKEALERHLDSLQRGVKDEVSGRYRFKSSDARERWLECRFVVNKDGQGRTTGWRGVLRDITRSYLQERHITHMALHDALTGLPNRMLLEDRLRQSLQQAERSGGRVAVCFVDLDHFKNVNDVYGHKAGDQMLVSLAQMLRACLREGDTLARWGGDEFVVLLPGLNEIEGARRVAEKMQQAMREPIELGDVKLHATFSMGIAIYPDDDKTGDIENLLSQADRAMFHAKSQGRNNFQLFSDMGSRGAGRREQALGSRLVRAVREGDAEVWFQPQMTAAGEHRMAGVEALARWHDDQEGWIAPSKFIAMAENMGVIGELGKVMRDKSLQQMALWRREHPDLRMSLNISKREVFAADCVARLQNEVARWGLRPADVVLEITESVALMDVDFAEDRLTALSRCGFRLSIDDFGTGYASLSQLHDLPVDEIKIDMAFVRRLNTPQGLRLVQSIVSMAKALGLSTVAEGVEDERAAQLLGELGVDMLQGYYFARPSPAGELQDMPLFARQGVAVH